MRVDLLLTSIADTVLSWVFGLALIAEVVVIGILLYRKKVIRGGVERSFSSISVKSFVTVVSLLAAIILCSGLISYFIPQGSFERDAEGAIIPDTYVRGKTEGIPFWKVVTAPIRVFASSDAVTIIMISVFLLVMSGVFNIMEKTGGVSVFIRKVVAKCGKRRMLVICVATLIFMAFGSFFGMFEELVTLLPIMIVFMLSLGFDTMTGLGVCMMAACFGFSAAITNPFSVGLASQFAGIGVIDGVWLRAVFFICVYAIVIGFLVLHIRRITKDPSKSPSYDVDREKLTQLDLSVRQETARDKRLFVVYAIFFSVQLVLLVCIAAIRAISDYAIPILAASFLIGGLVSGLLVDKPKKVFVWFGKGVLSMIPAVLLIGMASSVKLILAESNVLDTVMNYVISGLNRIHSKFIIVLLLYALILFLQIFIGSASAKIFLLLPIVLPISQALGISSTLVILTYCIADGFTDMILPTNPVLLIGLSMANVSYGKWVKWTWGLQLTMLLFTVAVLLLASSIGY